MGLFGKNVKVTKGIGKGREGKVVNEDYDPITKETTIRIRTKEGTLLSSFRPDQVKEK